LPENKLGEWNTRTEKSEKTWENPEKTSVLALAQMRNLDYNE
jgi:hypothetical protein